MTYSKTHTEDHCDRCEKKVGMKNLFMVPYLYKDCNDRVHKDQGNSYRQYYVCEKCYKTI